MLNDFSPFRHIYAIPQDFKVGEEDRDDYLISPDKVDAALQDDLLLTVSLLHEDYGVLDYDQHHGSEGMEKYQEHRRRYPNFFENTRIERTARDGYHVFFNSVGSLPGKPWEEVDVLDGVNHHWIVIPPSINKHGIYVLEQDKPVQDLPKGLLEEIRSAGTRISNPSSAEGNGHTIDLSEWNPKRLTGQCSPQTYSYYTAQSSRSKADLICDGDCGPFYRKSNGEWIKVTRHGEIHRVVKERLQPFIVNNRMIGPAELNKVFTDVTYLNDLWKCSKCGPKFANTAQIVSDIERIIAGMPGTPRFWSTNMVGVPQEVLVPDFFYVAPHETVIAGPKGKGKSHLAAHMAKMFMEKTGKKVLWLTLDESAASVNDKVPQAFVFSSKNNLGTLSEYVFENETDIEQVLERAIESVDFDEGLLVIEPWTFFYKGLSKAQDDYIKSYEAMAALKKLAPGFHTILCGHTSKGQSEDRGAEAILGTTGLAGSTRFGWNVNMDTSGQRYVSAWGNDQTSDLRFSPIIDTNGYRLEPFEKVNVKAVIAEILTTGAAEDGPLVMDILSNEYPDVPFTEKDGFIYSPAFPSRGGAREFNYTGE